MKSRNSSDVTHDTPDGQGSNDAQQRRMRIVQVKETIKENPIITTIRFNDTAPYPGKPGQFMMVWIPGLDEIPMGVSFIGPEKGFSVHALGEATEALSDLKAGDKIGIRGPLGNGFSLPKKGKRVLAVVGGTGIAPVTPLLESMAQDGYDVTVCIGAKTKEQLFMVGHLEKAGVKVRISTDDGTLGAKGFVTAPAIELMHEFGPYKEGSQENGFAMIYTCGPEVMMKKLLQQAQHLNIPIQLSLERYMKCGIGICDSCAIGGLQVYKDGPVFSGDILSLEQMEDFGNYKRSPAGKKERM